MKRVRYQDPPASEFYATGAGCMCLHIDRRCRYQPGLYKDSTITEAIVLCAELEIEDLPRSLICALKDEPPDAVLHSLRKLLSRIGPEHITPMYVNFVLSSWLPRGLDLLAFVASWLISIFSVKQYVLKHKSAERRYRSLCSIIQCEALLYTSEPNPQPRMTAMIDSCLATIFLDLGDLSDQAAQWFAQVSVNEVQDSNYRKLYERIF